MPGPSANWFPADYFRLESQRSPALPGWGLIDQPPLGSGLGQASPALVLPDSLVGFSTLWLPVTITTVVHKRGDHS